MSPRALAGRVLALLDPGDRPVLVVGRDAAAWRRALEAVGAVPASDEAGARVDAAVVSFLGEPAAADRRCVLLAEVRARLEPGGRLVLVDHNQPRRVWARLLAVPTLWARGLGSARARHPAARELAAQGFAVERLRLAAAERVQLVAARPRDDAPVRSA